MGESMTDVRWELMRGQIDDRRLEIENRIKNLFWTVSGDYTLDVQPDLEAFARSKYIALYDVIKQGAFAKFFDMEQLGLYLVKKLSGGADEKQLMELTQLCVDAAVYPRIRTERLGIEEIRRRAFRDILAHQGTAMCQTYFGKAKYVSMRRFLGEDISAADPAAVQTADEIDALESTPDTQAIITAIDRIYNAAFVVTGGTFGGRRGDWANPLTAEQKSALAREYLDDGQMEDLVKNYLSKLGRDVMRLEITEERRASAPKLSPGQLDEAPEPDPASVKRVHEYVELYYGKSYLTPLEQERKNAQLCKGMHRNCFLYYTTGILRAPAVKNVQYRLSQLHYEKNRLYYYNNYWVIQRNIAALADMLKKALVMLSEDSVQRATTGQLAPERLWKLDRTCDVKLFNKTLKAENSSFVVDILLDGSGSQARRQAQVAAQGYIIAEALSLAGIPNRVSSYCTFWNHTVMQRFRDYDDKKDENSRIFEFCASANNRDGLAIKATYDTLLARPETNKILIILSDGKPSDVGVNRKGIRHPRPYFGEDAVKDTAFEVRRARVFGILVLGVFAGNYEDVSTEKKIYGKDFAYIRDISNFSRIVGSYLRKQLDTD